MRTAGRRVAAARGLRGKDTSQSLDAVAMRTPRVPLTTAQTSGGLKLAMGYARLLWESPFAYYLQYFHHYLVYINWVCASP